MVVDSKLLLARQSKSIKLDFFIIVFYARRFKLFACPRIKVDQIGIFIHAQGQGDRDRALLSFTSSSDQCTNISGSGPDAISAANSNCESAFQALERAGLMDESCRGWRQAGCRFISAVNQVRCSVVVRTCNVWVSTTKVKTFRDCSFYFRLQEEINEEPPQHSDTYSRVKRDLDQRIEAAQSKRKKGKSASQGSYFSRIVRFLVVSPDCSRMQGCRHFFGAINQPQS